MNGSAAAAAGTVCTAGPDTLLNDAENGSAAAGPAVEDTDPETEEGTALTIGADAKSCQSS
jgi:hypothetical protein